VKIIPSTSFQKLAWQRLQAGALLFTSKQNGGDGSKKEEGNDTEEVVI
jgi:hypothetical protein